MRDAKLLLRQADELQSSANILQNEVRGKLAVGCMVTLAPMIAPALGHAFMNTYPDAKLTITEASHDDLLGRLKLVEIDVALTNDLTIPPDLEFEELASMPPHLLLAPDHRYAGRQHLTLADMAHEPLVLLDLPHSSQYFLSLFERVGVQPLIHARSNNQEVVRTMDGRPLVSVALAGEHRAVRIGLMTLKQVRKPRLQRAFEEHCRAMIRAGSIPGMNMG